MESILHSAESAKADGNKVSDDRQPTTVGETIARWSRTVFHLLSFNQR